MAAQLTTEYIYDLLNYWKIQLNLIEWDIKLDFEKSTESRDELDAPHAAIWRSKDYDEATITLHPNWRNWNLTEASQNIVHELLHCKLRDVEHIIDLIDGQLHRDADKMVCASFQHALEGFIDRMARILVQMDDRELKGKK